MHKATFFFNKKNGNVHPPRGKEGIFWTPPRGKEGIFWTPPLPWEGGDVPPPPEGEKGTTTATNQGGSKPTSQFWSMGFWRLPLRLKKTTKNKREMGHKTPLGASPSVALRAGATPLGPCAPGLAPPFGLHARVPSHPQGLKRPGLLRPGLKRPGLKRPLRLKCLFGTGSNARPSSLVCPGGQWWRRLLRVRPLNWGGHHFFFFKAGEPLRLLAGTRTWLLAKLTTNKKKQEPKPLSFLEKWELFGGL